MNISKTFLILGGTGMVGQQLIAQALCSEQIAHIVAPTRKPLATHKKLANPIVDFNDLPGSAEWWKADAVLCALGTTMKQAGSEAAFRHVDYDYVMQTAELAKAAGSNCLVLNSSLGANANSSNVYLKVKGELERDLIALKFASLTIIRPSLLDAGKRAEQRLGEQIGLWFGTRLSGIIPKRIRPISTQRVAQAMLQAAIDAKPGTHIIESEQLHQ
jgi:uncharacterized protein YbjT (DUF2867 family)